MGAAGSGSPCASPDAELVVERRWSAPSAAATTPKSKSSGTLPPLTSPSAPPSPSSSGGGLAARRKFAPRTGKEKLQIVTKAEVLQRGPRSIRPCTAVADEYDLGEEVMPSCHRGMQVVNATQKTSGRAVVVKVRFKKESFRTKEEETEWRSSTEFMLNLPASSNIAQLYEVLEDAQAYYVVMEKVAGQDLFESISGQELLPIPEVKEILYQVLSALADLHTSGRIHKDLKLENVMLDRTPSTARSISKVPTSPVSVKLIDFDTVEEFVPETPKRTKDVLGTDQYIAQEAYDGNYSPASDIFAAGVIAYRLLTGKFPFKADMFDDKPGENWVGSPKMKEIRTKVRTFKIKWTYKAFDTEPLACELLKCMLAVREVDRPTAREALGHPWLANTPSSPSGRASGPEGARRVLLPNCVVDG